MSHIWWWLFNTLVPPSREPCFEMTQISAVTYVIYIIILFLFCWFTQRIFDPLMMVHLTSINGRWPNYLSLAFYVDICQFNNLRDKIIIKSSSKILAQIIFVFTELNLIYLNNLSRLVRDFLLNLVMIRSSKDPI